MKITRRVRYLVWGAGIIVGLALTRSVVLGVEDWMRANPERLPPAWQARRQAALLAHSVVIDHEVGFLLPANEDEIVDTLDFSFRRTTDAFGFPNLGTWPEHADIVFLGDSLLLSEGLGVENGFTTLIDEMLPDDRVVNLGNPGAGIERQYFIHRRFGVPLDPDLVVVSLYLASDLSNDKSFRGWIENSEGMEYNRFRLSYGRRNDTRSFFNPTKRLEGHPLFSWAQSIIEPKLGGKFRILHQADLADGTEYFFNRQNVQFARTPASEYAVELQTLFESLERFQYLVEASGEGNLVVMLIPAKEELFAISADDEPENILAHVTNRLSELGLPFLDLYPTLGARGAEESVYFPRDIHFNALGNQIVAESFVEWREAADR